MTMSRYPPAASCDLHHGVLVRQIDVDCSSHIRRCSLRLAAKIDVANLVTRVRVENEISTGDAYFPNKLQRLRIENGHGFVSPVAR